MTSAVEVSAEPRAALDRIPALDGLRGLAILMVMFYHYGVGINHQHSLVQHVVWSLSGFGWTGVDLFFVLSGFLITRILLQSRDADDYFSSFYARRFLRICPIYYVSLFVLFLVVPFILRTESAQMPSLHERLWYFAYVQNWLNVFGRMSWPIMLTHYWSLGVEEQFYLIWPLIIYCLPPKRLLQSIIGACVFSLILRLTLMALLVSPETIYRNTFTRMDALFIGAACALLIRNELWTEKIRAYAAWLCCAPLVTLAALRTQPFRATAPTELGLGYTVIALSYAALLMAIVTTTNSGSVLQRLLSSRMMRAFGKYSYAAYIWHILIRLLAQHYELQTFHLLFPALVNIPLMIAVTMAVSALSYVIVERPFLALRSYFEPRPGSASLETYYKLAIPEIQPSAGQIGTAD